MSRRFRRLNRGTKIPGVVLFQTVNTTDTQRSRTTRRIRYSRIFNRRLTTRRPCIASAPRQGASFLESQGRPRGPRLGASYLESQGGVDLASTVCIQGYAPSETVYKDWHCSYCPVSWNLVVSSSCLVHLVCLVSDSCLGLESDNSIIYIGADIRSRSRFDSIPGSTPTTR